MVRVEREFAAVARFHHVIGAMDGTHLAILPVIRRKMYYVDRKSHTTINMHAVVSARRKFIHFDAGWPGSVHDARVFVNSDLGTSLTSPSPSQRVVPDGHFILADSAYPLTPFILTPYDKVTTPEQASYNAAHARTRVVVECVFGIFKRKWQLFGHARFSALWTARLAKIAAALQNLDVDMRTEVEFTVADRIDEDNSAAFAYPRPPLPFSHSDAIGADYGSTVIRTAGVAVRNAVASAIHGSL
jgi:hypothetical protein